VPASRLIRFAGRLSLAAACAPLLAAPLSAPAWPHAILRRGVPAIGGSVPAGKLAVELHYNSRIDAARSRLTLTGPDQPARTLPLADAEAPDVLRADVTLAPGRYTLRWQVLATDGHITRGDVPFTVTGP
jgi:methionine-rich copper-binding protein CopC